MKFSELTLKRLLDKDNLSIEDEIACNILNFIHCIHLNKQNFYKARFDTEYYIDPEMTFKKDSNSLIGHIRAISNKEKKTYDYLFTENGFEKLEEVIHG